MPDSPLSLQDFQFVRDLVKQRSAIVLEDNKSYLVEARLTMLLRQIGLNSLAELITQVRVNLNGPLAQRVVNAMTTNETSFFRDAHPFEVLKQQIIPQLIKSRQQEKTLRIWCAAASSGQEPYSIAMILQEYFREPLTGWKIEIIATDISDEIVASARSGIYSQLAVNRGLPIVLLMKYFQKEGLMWKINDEIRHMIDFRVMNLVGNWSLMPKFDVIFLRNVLIYFELDVKKQILEKIHRTVRPDGCLFLGATETVSNLDDLFHNAQNTESFYYIPRTSEQRSAK